MTDPTTRVFDGHNDCLLRLPDHTPATAFLDGRDDGHLDLPRAVEGGLGGGLFALFISPSPETTSREQRRTDTSDGFHLDPPPMLRPAYARDETKRLLDRLDAVLDAADDRIVLVTTADELRSTVPADDQLACVLHFEGAPMIAPDCSNLDDR